MVRCGICWEMFCGRDLSDDGLCVTCYDAQVDLEENRGKRVWRLARSREYRQAKKERLAALHESRQM